MKIGILLTPGAEAVNQTRRAEDAGFESVFFIDSPVIFGDLFVTMATAAACTRRIKLATGVTNPLTRSVPVAASAIASLNAMAPGRIMVGIGRGYTANFAMGHRNSTLKELTTFVDQLRAMLRGETIHTDVGQGHSSYVAFLTSDTNRVNTNHPPPLIIAAAGPKALALAGQSGDGVLLGGIAHPDIIRKALSFVTDSEDISSDLSPSRDVSITPATYVVDRPIGFDELQDVLGPKSIAPAGTAAPMGAMALGEESPVVRDLIAAQQAYRPDEIPGEDPARKHLRVYRQYLTNLEEWQRPLVTRNVLDVTSLAGTPDDAVLKLQQLAAAGITRVILSPMPQHVDDTIAVFGQRVIPRLIGGKE